MPRPPRPTRRALLTASILLLAGAVVNVGVAWGIAGLGAQPFAGWAPQTFRDETAGWHIRLDPPGNDVRTSQWTLGYWRCHEFDLDGQLRGYTIAFGWPRPSLRVRDPLHGKWDLPAPARVVSAGLFERSDGLIPIDPIPAGFAINTLFYAVVVGAILALPLSVFPIRRRLRTRRGRCPKCGYDLAGLGGADPAAPCPECGAAQ